MAKFMLSAFSDEAAPAFDDQLRILNEEGISMMEMRMLDGKSCIGLTLEEAKELKNKMDAAGIGFSALGSPYGKIGIDEDFGPHFESFLHGLELCKVMGCRQIRMFSFYIPEGIDPETRKDEVFGRLEKMVDAAEKAGIRLCHENEKGIYGDNAVRCRELMDRFAPRMGFIFDPANFIQCGVNTLEAFELLHDRIDYMHIKDAMASDGAVVRAGRGDGHVPEILERFSLEKEGAFILTVEPHLTLFSGLGNLQQESLAGREVFANNRESFHAAVEALKEIIEKLEGK